MTDTWARRSGLGAGSWLSVLAVAASGCGEGSADAACGAWQARQADVCVARRWVLPDSGDGVYAGDLRHVRVAVSGFGQTVAAWVVSEPSGGRVEVAENPGLPGRPPTLHSPSEGLIGNATQVTLAAGPSGEAIVAWKAEVGDGASLFRSERDADGRWRDPASDADTFSFAPTAYEPVAAYAPTGELLLVWNQWTDTGYGVAVASKRPGGHWAEPAGPGAVRSRRVFHSNAPTPAWNRRGDAILAWYQSDGEALLAWVSERPVGASEFAVPGPSDALSPRETAVDSHPFSNPRPALSDDGDAVVAWTQEDGDGGAVVMLATRAAGAPWVRPESLADAISAPGATARCVQPAFTPSGALILVWYDDAVGMSRVVAARRSPAGAWDVPGSSPELLSTPGREAVAPALAVGLGGGVLVVWSERVDGAWTVMARRGDARSWGPIERLSPPGGDAVQPTVAIGSSRDVAIVGWRQGGATDASFFAALVP